MSDKIPIIPEAEVKGNIQAHRQLYSFSFLPKTIDLSEKIELQVKTDVFNSIRFELDNQLWQFVEDSFFAYMVFLELKVNPQYKEKFRVAQLNSHIDLLKKKCINEWKKSESRTGSLFIEYQKHIIY